MARRIAKENARARGVRQAKAKERRANGRLACAACGWTMPASLNAKGVGVHGHHAIPVAKGGDAGLRNVVLLCPNHHAIAHALGDLPYRYADGLLLAGRAKMRLLRMLRQIDRDAEALAK